MTLLISLIITFLFIGIGHKFIKKNANLCYIIAALVSIILITFEYTKLSSSFPLWLNNILSIFTRSAFSTALFIVVMYTGALKNGSKLIKILMPIRAELSIIASILTLGHNIIYGKTYFVKLFTNPGSIKGNVLLAAIVSLILILIMLPLMITSFQKVRRKIQPKKWKKLQRTAYLFYGLIYVHIMLLIMPSAFNGNVIYIFNVILYSIIFLTYAVMRIRKAFTKKKLPKVYLNSVIAIGIIIFLAIGGSILYFNNKERKSNENTITNTLKDGTFTGNGEGFRGNIEVEVLVKDGKIIEINIINSSDDKAFLNKASKGIIEKIINEQNTDVDVVSGATYSSNGIINAVKDALK